MFEQLEQLAKAATPGPWKATVLSGEGSSNYAAIYPDTEPGPAPVFVTSGIDRRDAQFIAAANPEAILRLIAEVRNLRHTTEADLEYQRRLEARLAAVEARLAGEGYY